ncbi:MAG: hypothetical protein ACXV2C_00025 [Candidatus Bathyarchaeia archaeon]
MHTTKLLHHLCHLALYLGVLCYVILDRTNETNLAVTPLQNTSFCVWTQNQTFHSSEVSCTDSGMRLPTQWGDLLGYRCFLNKTEGAKVTLAWPDGWVGEPVQPLMNWKCMKGINGATYGFYLEFFSYQLVVNLDLMGTNYC